MVLIISSSFGLVWGIIYLIFSLMHSMTEMFNEEFIFLIANIFNVKVATTLTGFVYTFIDGSLLGVILALFLVKIRKKIIDKNEYRKNHKHF